jgi:hypothetical protein
MPLDDTGFKLTTQPFSDLSLLAIEETRAEAWRNHVLTKFKNKSHNKSILVMRGTARWKVEFGPAVVAYLKHAPKVVRQLAKDVQIAHPDAKLAIGYFYADPILYVYPNPNSFANRLCLAIWDKRVVRAIADDVELNPMQRVLRRWVKTV